MTQVAAIQEVRPSGIIAAMAEKHGMHPQAYEATLRATVVPKDCSKEQFAAFLMVAKEYDLNPILKEIFAFPTRAGGIQPIVSIDGWMNIINSHPQMDGMEFEDVRNDKGEVIAITCRIYRKDRARPMSVTEYMAECKRNTDTWKTWPIRMLRHKAAIQAARYAFGLSGIIEPDEFERMNNDGVVTKLVPSPPSPPSPPPAPKPEPAPITGELVEKIIEGVVIDHNADPASHEDIIAEFSARLKDADRKTQEEIFEEIEAYRERTGAMSPAEYNELFALIKE